MRIFLSGPMTGLPEWNQPAFNAAAKRLRDTGHEVWNPAEIDNSSTDKPAEFYMMFNFSALARPPVDPSKFSYWDAMALLPGWEKSVNGGRERAVAGGLGIPLVDAENLQPMKISSSGEVRTTDPQTGGQKGAKPARFDLIPPYPLFAVAEVFNYGSKKYADHNWMRGYKWSLCFSACQRHLWAYWGGEPLDPESGLPHLAHAAWHCFALLEFMHRHPEKDDRPPKFELKIK